MIACQRFTGVETARLSAQGAGGYSGRGGGGRIAVWEGVPTSLQAKLFAGTPGSAILSETPFVDYLGAVDVSGGSVGGEAGTVWFITARHPGWLLSYGN